MVEEVDFSLIKGKKYKWKETNLALFGSDLEKKVVGCFVRRSCLSFIQGAGASCVGQLISMHAPIMRSCIIFLKGIQVMCAAVDRQ